MSSAESSSRRRRRVDIEEDEEEDDIRSSQASSPSRSGKKRVRTNGNHRDLEAESPEPEHSRANSSPERDDDDDDDNESTNGETKSEFQPGSIRRVKLTNFVTYEKAEFFPGPNLNMVIGPNGTGKSSLVCAICLGLGLSPKHLGRAGEVGEFVKHNMSEAEIEIELERRPEDAKNYIVRVKIIRDGNARDWYINGKKVPLKNVQELTKKLSIQIDNLCQFLPQDKVSEFAALSPVELLLQTQRAAAPEIMLKQHEQLKQRRKEQKVIEESNVADQEILESMETRQQNLQAEVQRLKEREEILQRVAFLKKRIPFVEYRIARAAHIVCKNKKNKAQHRLRSLHDRVEPLLATVRQKESNQDQITTVVREREQILRAAEQEAKGIIDELEHIDVKINEIEGKLQGEGSTDAARKIAMRKIQQNITHLEAKLNEAPVDFNAGEWNDKIAKLQQEIRDLNKKLAEAREEGARLNQIAKSKQEEILRVNEELKLFNSAEGQLISKLDALSRDTAEAWKWVQANQHEFEKEVFGPPLVTCSVKDPKCASVLESLVQRNILLALTPQTSKDWKTLTRVLIQEKRLADITLKQCATPLSDYPKLQVSDDEMRSYGFDGWALDLIDGPQPVLSMLCSNARLHTTAIGSQETTEAQHSRIMGSRINNWVTGKHSNRVLRRAEYGASATTVNTQLIKPAQYWTNSPIDTSKRDEIQSRIDTATNDMAQLRIEILPIRATIEGLKAAIETKAQEEAQAKADKSEKQKAYTARMNIPGKIEAERANEAGKRQEGVEIRERVDVLYTEHDNHALRKSQLALDHKDIVTKLRLGHSSLIEAKIRLIETKSDISSLNERNRDIREQVEREEELVRAVEQESKRVKAVAARALEVCNEISAEPDFEIFRAAVGREDEDGLTVEMLDQEIAAEESKLEFMHANNPNAIQEYEKRQKDVERLTEKIALHTKRIADIGRYITITRNKWEPELDSLVAKISEAFSFNFEQIGCAGQVSVHKDDDFENWAIQIKVRFREHETLQILDAQRQSGGERSVSTIFYLMSLQSMARAPFRVVDEINQGMDPRNERMVHERMVEIACKEHTSQYFLITPKLLTGLRYDKRMKVLCIASGEHMPENYKKLDISRVLGIQRSLMASG